MGFFGVFIHWWKLNFIYHLREVRRRDEFFRCCIDSDIKKLWSNKRKVAADCFIHKNVESSAEQSYQPSITFFAPFSTFVLRLFFISHSFFRKLYQLFTREYTPSHLLFTTAFLIFLRWIGDTLVCRLKIGKTDAKKNCFISFMWWMKIPSPFYFFPVNLQRWCKF